MRAITGIASSVLSLLLLALPGVVVHGKEIIVVKPLPVHPPSRDHGHVRGDHKKGSGGNQRATEDRGPGMDESKTEN